MISHPFRCIFIHIPRTAGSYIETRISGTNWWKVQPETKHILASQAKEIYSQYWDDYFKFSFVRNPWGRMVSLCKFPNMYGVKKENGKIDIKGYKKKFGYPLCIENDYRFSKRRQVKKPCHQRQSVYCNVLDEELDFIGKTENLEADLSYVFDIIKQNCDKKLASHPMQQALLQRMSNRKNIFKPLKQYKEFYSDSTIEEVADLYKEDIRNFGYEFGQ